MNDPLKRRPPDAQDPPSTGVDVGPGGRGCVGEMPALLEKLVSHPLLGRCLNDFPIGTFCIDKVMTLDSEA